jgi:hypothetical protein
MPFAKNIKIKGIEIDLEAICSISHNCRSELCSIDNFCCSKYDIMVDTHELQRVIDWMLPASKYSTNLIEDGEPVNVFSEINSRCYLIDTTEEEVCVFAWESQKNGAVFCSLHSAALEHGLEPYSIKPADCVRWPLALVNNRHLTVVYDAFDFPCNLEKDPADRVICSSIEKIIENLYGTNFLLKLKSALKDMT